MKKSLNDLNAQHFRDAIDNELKHIAVSPQVREHVRQSVGRRPGCLRAWLNREVAIAVPQLAAVGLLLLVAGGAYWQLTFSVSDHILARYEKPVVIWVTDSNTETISSPL